MKIIVKDKGRGKTTGTIYTSETMNIPIMVDTYSHDEHIQEMASSMNATIPEVLVLDKYKHYGIRIPDNILIDNGFHIIEKSLKSYLGCNVAAVTLSS